MKAVALLRKGWSQSQVAREVDVHRQSVSRWAATLAAEGRAALRKAGRAGRRPRLSEENLDRLAELLEAGPEAAGFSSNLWTCERVGQLIEREFGVEYHEGHVWRVLRHLGWSCQRPTGRAIERDEEAIRRWKRVEWPRIKKKPSGKAASSSSSTKAASRSDRTASAPGRRGGKPQSSSTTSRGKRSRRSQE